MNFNENPIFKSPENALIDTLHTKFDRIKKFQQPNIDSFRTLEGYSLDDIEKEKTTVEKLKKQWIENNSEKANKNKELSEIFEGIIIEQLTASWLKGKGEAYYSSEADDLLRHVDCVIESNPEEGKKDRHHLGLGIDVTFASDYSSVTSKLDYIWEHDIKNGKQTEIKYVETENYKGKLSMHRVVLVCNKETVLELARLYKDKNQDALSTHPYLASIIGQIKIQLETNYAHTVNRQLGGKATERILETLRNFYRVYTAQEVFYESNLDYLETNREFQMVKDYCAEKLGTKIQ
jgi:hypothetical protein